MCKPGGATWAGPPAPGPRVGGRARTPETPSLAHWHSVSRLRLRLTFRATRSAVCGDFARAWNRLDCLCGATRAPLRPHQCPTSCGRRCPCDLTRIGVAASLQLSPLARSLVASATTARVQERGCSSAERPPNPRARASTLPLDVTPTLSGYSLAANRASSPAFFVCECPSRSRPPQSRRPPPPSSPPRCSLPRCARRGAPAPFPRARRPHHGHAPRLRTRASRAPCESSEPSRACLCFGEILAAAGRYIYALTHGESSFTLRVHPPPPRHPSRVSPQQPGRDVRRHSAKSGTSSS